MIKYLQLPTCKLAEFAGAGDTSFTVSGFLYNDGVTPVDPADIGDICFATLEPKTAREELISFTITSVDAAGVATIVATRGLLQKSPYGTGGATFDHQSGTDFVISNNPGLFNKLTAKDNAEVITAQWSFPAPSANNSPATKAYADSLVILGGAEATNLTRGISLLSADPATTIGVMTVTVATPAVISIVGHGRIAGDSIKITTTGALPTGLVANTRYFVQAAGLTANTFRVSATLGGVDINTTGTQSGVHTLVSITPVAVGYNDITKLPSLLEKAAMAGGGLFGAPSGSNKFATEALITAKETQIVSFTVSGTWTKQPGLKRVKIRMWGGGGSGGGSGSAGVNNAGGGGGGGFREIFKEAADLGATEVVTIGAGGAATSLSTGSNVGNTGGTTSFGSIASVLGGSGGPVNNGSNPGGNGGGFIGGVGVNGLTGGHGTEEGGAAGGGAYSTGGTVGNGGNAVYGGGGGGGAYNILAASGGISFNGGNGGAASNTASPATAGSTPGGGGGAHRYNGGSASGAAGGGGKIEITEYYI